jgi:hypothetical protein
MEEDMPPARFKKISENDLEYLNSILDKIRN